MQMTYWSIKSYRFPFRGDTMNTVLQTYIEKIVHIPRLHLLARDLAVSTDNANINRGGGAASRYGSWA